MLTEDGKHLYVSYDEYHNLIEKLALKIHQSGWHFDTILCLARGGMRLRIVAAAMHRIERLGRRQAGVDELACPVDERHFGSAAPSAR